MKKIKRIDHKNYINDKENHTLSAIPEVDETIAENLQTWLRYNQTSLNEILPKWIQSYPYRRRQIVQTVESTSNIFNDWPLFKNCNFAIPLVT